LRSKRQCVFGTERLGIDAANAIEVVTRNQRVSVSQSFNDRFVGQPDSGTCVLLFFHLDANLIKILVGTSFLCVFILLKDKRRLKMKFNPLKREKFWVIVSVK
jgi:hypothetical protein